MELRRSRRSLSFVDVKTGSDSSNTTSDIETAIAEKRPDDDASASSLIRQGDANNKPDGEQDIPLLTAIGAYRDEKMDLRQHIWNEMDDTASVASTASIEIIISDEDCVSLEEFEY